MVVRVGLEDEAGTQCLVVLLRGVTNVSELRQRLLQGQVQASLIKPAMVVDPFQVVVAANKAVRAQAAKKMVTRSVYSEIIFNMYPTKHISQSLKTFGLGEEDQDVLAVVLQSAGDEDKMEKLLGQVKGESVEVSALATLTDTARVQELYKVTQEELCVSSLLDAVISRMACKEFLSM